MASALYPALAVDAKDAAAPVQEVKSPFQDAHTAITRLKATTRTAESRMDNLFWRILSGPLYFLLAYTTNEAACELQRQWEGAVLVEVQDTPDAKLRKTLFAKDQGLVWKFVSGPAKPFIGRDAKGYYARDFLKHEFPFQKNFLLFLDGGGVLEQRILPEYTVSLQARPLGVNQGALLDPYAVTLTLNCADGVQKLDNYNYPANLDFKWKPDSCGDATLQIRFDDFTLTKTYAGVYGFPRFLEEFRDGTRTFTAKDFSGRAADLKGIRVSQIQVHYVISGAEPVRALRSTRRTPIPASIVDCFGK